MRHLSSALVLFSLAAVACNDGKGGSKRPDGAAGMTGDGPSAPSEVHGTGGAIVGTGGSFVGGSGGVAGAPGAGGSTGSAARDAAVVDVATPTLDSGVAVDVGSPLDGTRIDVPSDSRTDASIADGDGGGPKVDGAPDALFEGAFSYTGGMSVGRWYHTAIRIVELVLAGGCVERHAQVGCRIGGDVRVDGVDRRADLDRVGGVQPSDGAAVGGGTVEHAGVQLHRAARPRARSPVAASVGRAGAAASGWRCNGGAAASEDDAVDAPIGRRVRRPAVQPMAFRAEAVVP